MKGTRRRSKNMRFILRLLQDAVTVALICIVCTLLHIFISSHGQSAPLPMQAVSFVTGRSSPVASVATGVHAATSGSTVAKPTVGWRKMLPRIFAAEGTKAPVKERSFTADYSHGRLLKDGEPFRIIAGTIHYFRVPKASWKDRLLKMKRAGLNAVYTSVEWSGHEPERDVYDFERNYDIEAFLKTAQEVGLVVLLAVGPYIGAHRDNGGLPYWLSRDADPVKFRRCNDLTTAAVEDWFNALLPRLAPLLYHKGGPIIAVEIEHKYGSYGDCDPHYMEYLAQLIRLYLEDRVLLFTMDLPGIKHCGTVKGALLTLALTAGPSVEGQLSRIPSPHVVALDINEADRWEFPRARLDALLVLRSFKDLLAANASVILNVFHGGTNFGFRNGANLAPFTTSYDCGAPLSEAGDPTPLYYEIRKTIEGVRKRPEFVLPDWEPPLELGTVPLRCGPSTKAVMEHFRKGGAVKRVTSKHPLSFEAFGHGYGWVVYKTKVNFQPGSPSMLRGLQIKDRGYIYTRRSAFSVDSRMSQVPIAASRGEDLVILVENTGRSSSGNESYARKGLLSVPTLNERPLTGWTMEALPVTSRKDIDEITRLVQTAKQESVCKAPSFFSGTFTLPQGTAPRNTYLDLSGWTKGVAYINGFDLGRYWPAAGPQVTLFVPGSLLLPHPEQNLLLLFEMEGVESKRVELVSAPKLDGPTANRLE